MSRLDKDQENKTYEPPMLFGLDSLDDYLTELYGSINQKIKEVEKSRPKSFSNEEEWMLDGNIDEHIIGLAEVGQILIESALVAYYSYFERMIFSFCCEIDPIQEDLQAKLNAIKRHKGDVDKYRKFILKHHSIKNAKKLDDDWNKISNYQLMRKYIVHASLSKKNQDTLLNHVKSNTDIWYDSKHGSFSISLDYVRSFSRTISSYLTELDYLVYQKTGRNTLI